MTIVEQLLSNEVFPAIGCTEPISCAYAAALAAHQLGEPVVSVKLRVDPGTYKNGSAVTVPYTDGAVGNLIAAAIGAVLAKPQAKLQILQDTTPDDLRNACAMIASGNGSIDVVADAVDFFIEATVAGEAHSATAVLQMGHTHLTRLERDGELIVSNQSPKSLEPVELDYRERLKAMPLATMLEEVESLSDKTLGFIREGVTTNVALVQPGQSVNGVGRQLQLMHDKGYLRDDLFFRVKSRLAYSVDARMSGENLPVMTSGGSGNQGLVVTVTIHTVGMELGVEEDCILRAIAMAHSINGYIKCFVGELTAVCGCALGGGIAAACAIVYMLEGVDMEKMGMAVNNVIGDLGGIICDGAKPGCALKAVSSADSAMRAAFMAVERHGVRADNGIAASTAEETIRNLQKLINEGMTMVDPVVLDIMRKKRLPLSS